MLQQRITTAAASRSLRRCTSRRSLDVAVQDASLPMQIGNRLRNI